MIAIALGAALAVFAIAWFAFGSWLERDRARLDRSSELARRARAAELRARLAIRRRDRNAARAKAAADRYFARMARSRLNDDLLRDAAADAWAKVGRGRR